MSNPTQRNATDWNRQRKIAHLALAQFGFADAHIRLLKYADVINIRVATHADHKFVLRMHPPTRHPLTCLQSEVWWLDHLSRTSDVLVPQPQRTLGGDLVVEVHHKGETRWCSLFSFIDSHGKSDDFPRAISIERTRQLGETLAKLHDHAARIDLPDWFMRWEHQWIINEAAEQISQFGQNHLSTTDLHVMLQATERMDAATTRLDQHDRKAYGLIHADPNLGNWLYRDDGVALVDFEVCAFGFYAFDLARMLVGLMSIDAPSQAIEATYATYAAYASIRPMVALDSETMIAFMLQNQVDCVAFAISQPEFMADPVRRRKLDVWLDVTRRLMNMP